MAYHKVVSELMNFSINSYYMWEKENRPIISLLQKYLSEDDIKEFLSTGSISKFENIDHIKYDYHIKYFDFISELNDEELYVFLSLVNENKDDLLNFSSNFISILLEYNCENTIKTKLIESYSRIDNMNELSYYGLKNMLSDQFRDFYSFSIDYSIITEKYYISIKHLKYYLNIFENKKYKAIDELFPDIEIPEFEMTNESSQDYNYLDRDKKYYEYLLSLLD